MRGRLLTGIGTIAIEKDKLAKRIEEISVELTNELSVVESFGELDVSQKVYDIFSKLDYYQENPQDLRFLEIKGDPYWRKNVCAILRGKKNNSKKTVLLIGHTDTVGISDYGNLQDYANKPYELTEKFKEIADTLSTEAQNDLASGDYLFGRGLFDMKAGNAVIIALMEEISRNLEDFEGNIIYAAVCDEEANSAGMLSMVPEFVKIREKEGFEYLGLINTDYMTAEYEGDENKYVYVGAVGKLMPSFFIVGKESHVGEAFNGLDSNQIAAAITNRINVNVDFCDIAEGEATLPPITLKQRDLKSEYSVQIAQKSTLFFHYATHSSTPDEVMNKIIAATEEAFQSTIDLVNFQYKRFCDLIGREYKQLPWEARVMTYEELYHRVKKEMGEQLDSLIKEFEMKMMEDMSIDSRDFSLKLVEKVHSLWTDREPVVVAYFTPPYYPHIHVKGETVIEKNLIAAVEEAVNTTETDYKLVYKNFFPYISDISYGSAPKDPKVIRTLKDNMPGFGTKYHLPLEEMGNLNVPVLNIGTFGKDAHQFTERLEKKYSFEVTPELVYKTISNLLEG